MTKVFNRFHIFLSHHSFLYATIVGIGIVLFWRGVWHSADTLHLYINHYSTTRAFVSSFIGNELILSGLRIEKKIHKQTESDIQTEVSTITDIKHTISAISHKLEELEVQVKDHHK